MSYPRYKNRLYFRNLVRWSIKKLFEQEHEVCISLNELKYELGCAWNELVEEGVIVLENNEDD